MNILMIFTGGTIGSSTRDGITSPDPAAAQILLKTCTLQDDPAPDRLTGHAESVRTDTLIPYYILSEELNAVHLNLLTKTISDNLHKNYDGIIITHGSDTLHYTAALLDAMFAEASVPILLVCSNFPLDDPRANGIANLSAALAFLHQTPVPGVYVPYRNDPQTADTPVDIHRGSRLLRHAEASGDLHSIGDEPFARYENGFIIRNNACVFPDPAMTDVPAGRTVLCEHPEILQTLCVPGALYPVVPKQTQAVILLPYHSATLPVSDPAFTAFCAACRQRNIPILMPTAGCETCYSSSESFSSLGITTVPLPFISLYCRLWICISRKKQNSMRIV